MNRQPITVTITIILILISAAFWLFYAVYVAIAGVPSFPNAGAGRWIMAGLSFCVSVFLIGMVILLKRHNRLFFMAGIIFLGIIATLSITDQIGWIDLAVLLVNLAALLLLIKDRTWYLQTNR